MDPWSKVDYSGLIREALMVVEKLPEVNPPSGRVPGQGLLAAPILESRWRRNREEFVKKGSVLETLGKRCKYRTNGARGWPEGSRRPPGATPLWSHHQGAWSPGGSPLALLRGSRR